MGHADDKGFGASTVDLQQIEFTESSLAADGHRVPQTTKLSTEGLSGALESLLDTCPPANYPEPSQDRAEKWPTSVSMFSRQFSANSCTSSVA